MVKPPTPEEEDRRRVCRERKVLIAERVQHVNRLLALFSDGPGVRPEAQIDAPPIGGETAAVQFREEGVEVEGAFADGGVGGGLVIVEGAVGIDDVDVADLAA